MKADQFLIIVVELVREMATCAGGHPPADQAGVKHRNGYPKGAQIIRGGQAGDATAHDRNIDLDVGYEAWRGRKNNFRPKRFRLFVCSVHGSIRSPKALTPAR